MLNRPDSLSFDADGEYLIGEDLNLPAGNTPRTLIAWVRTESSGSLSSVAEWGTVDETGGRFGLLLDEAGRIYFSGRAVPISFNKAFSLLTVELGQQLYNSAINWSVLGSSGSVFEGLQEGEYALAASVDSDTRTSLTAADAFEALKIALGVAQVERDIGPYELIAADVNQDGRVGVIDAYIIAQSAVGKQVMPKRVLIDGDKDYSQMTSSTISYEEVIDLGSLAEGAHEVDLIGIQLGDLLLPELLT